MFAPAPQPLALPAPPTIEGNWRDASHSSLDAAKPPQIAGEIMQAAMFRDCWKRIEIETGIRADGWDGDTRRRVNGMLRRGGVALAGADRLQEAMRDVLEEKWRAKHGRCHDGQCDGTCGHDRYECDGQPQCIEDHKALLDLVGRAVGALDVVENDMGVVDSCCPKAVYERKYA